MISIDIHRQRFSKSWRMGRRFVLSPGETSVTLRYIERKKKFLK